MMKFTSSSSKHTELRIDADVRLRTGTAPPTKGWVIGTDALSLLYKLASHPDSAGDALKLLHELQAYQVELDLQHEQLEANEHELVELVARYKALYDHAPAGYFIVDFTGHIIESNLAGAELLGVTEDELDGCVVTDFLLPESRLAFMRILKQMTVSGAGASLVHSIDHGSGSQQIRLTANISPSREAILMVLSRQAPPAET